MGYKYTGDSVLGLSLTVNAPKPLDSRTVVDNLQQLYDIPEATAYQGMTVANIANGNIYMLVDKAKINEKAGWKASYESIQIIACSEEEYKLWQSNTDENYNPIDETQTYLHGDTYYYIYEDSINPDKLKEQAYVKYSQYESLEESVRNKASNSDLETLRKTVTANKETLETEYINSATIEEIYVTKDYVEELIDTENEESFISGILNNYYDKDTVNSTFVTIDSLKGESEDTGFIFVNKTDYAEDQAKIESVLASTLKTEEDGSIKNLTVQTITSSDNELNIKTEKLYINSEEVALSSNVPEIITLEQTEYDNLLKSGKLQTNAYYCTYSEDQKDGIITNEALESNYYTKAQVQTMIQDSIRPLLQRIAKLEGATAILDLGVLDEMKLG